MRKKERQTRPQITVVLKVNVGDNVVSRSKCLDTLGEHLLAMQCKAAGGKGCLNYKKNPKLQGGDIRSYYSFVVKRFIHLKCNHCDQLGE